MIDVDPRDQDPWRPVLRHEWYCNQMCLHSSNEAEVQVSSESGSDEPDEPDSSQQEQPCADDDEAPPEKDRGFVYSKAKCKVKLVVSTSILNIQSEQQSHLIDSLSG